MNRKILCISTFFIVAINLANLNSVNAQILGSENLFKADVNTFALWRFNDVSGSQVINETGINNGTAIGTTIVDGKFGKARYFNGQSDYIAVPHSSSLTNFSQITIEAWVYPSGFDLGCWNQNQSLVSKGDRTLSATIDYDLGIDRNVDTSCGSATSFRQLKFSGGFNGVGVGSSIWHNPNQWYYVAFTYDGNYLKLYVNNVLEASSSYAPNLLIPSTNYPLYINHHTWSYGYASSQRIRGIIDEIRISKVARSAEEIAYYYNLATNPNQAPTISNFKQYKSDGQTEISEGGTTTESLIAFKAILNDQDNDQIKLQIELKEFNQSFNEQDLIESEFISSGSEAIITRTELVDGQYKWRARAIDDKGNKSDWQEFGIAGNADFKVKLVPLYTQVRSPYPSDNETKIWANLDYANGNSSCGSKIYQCGCALTSAVMISRYYNITNVNNNDVNPGTLNNWLNSQPKGYSSGGSVNWLDIARYSNNLVKYDIAKSGDYLNNYAILNEYLDKNQPAIAKEKSGRGGINREHFIVIDNKLASAYGVKDPAWYNTKKLNEITDSANKIRGYENGFDGLRLFYPSNGLTVSALSFNLASPAEFLVIDPLGRRFGKDPMTNIKYNEIPGASYFTEGIDDPTGELPSSDHENKILYIENPLDGQYDIKVIGTDSGSYTVDSAVYDNQGQTHTQTFTGNTNTNITASYNLNYDSQQPSNISIQPEDTEAPVISHTQLNSEYILNSAPIAFNFSAQDIETGVFKLSATLDGQLITSGQIVNLNQLGNHTIEITAEDYIGNKKTETIVYKVIYNFGGFLSPIKADGSGMYKLGRTLPVKFQLKDTNGVFIPNAVAQLFVTKISNGIIGTDEIPLSTSNTNTGNIFRYDLENNQYIYNLSTNTLSTGSWRLKVILNDGKYYTVIVSFK